MFEDILNYAFCSELFLLKYETGGLIFIMT